MRCGATGLTLIGARIAHARERGRRRLCRLAGRGRRLGDRGRRFARNTHPTVRIETTAKVEQTGSALLALSHVALRVALAGRRGRLVGRRPTHAAPTGARATVRIACTRTVGCIRTGEIHRISKRRACRRGAILVLDTELIFVRPAGAAVRRTAAPDVQEGPGPLDLTGQRQLVGSIGIVIGNEPWFRAETTTVQRARFQEVFVGHPDPTGNLSKCRH